MNNIIKVDYYDAFRCTADKCPYTCCQEWAITVDDSALGKWEGLTLDVLDAEGKKQSEMVLCDCLEKEGTGHIISLDGNSKCPFLSKNNLCRMVVELGEDKLTDICASYPRHINKYEDRTEYSLDFGCPAVIDLLNEKFEGIVYEIEEGEAYESSVLFSVREMMLGIIQDESYSLPERLMMISNCLLELLEEEHVTEEMLEGYEESEYLEALANEIRKVELDTIESFWERNELFLDMTQVYREQENYVEYLEDIAMWADRLGEYYTDTDLLDKIEAFEKEYTAYHKLLINYLTAEIFASALTPEMDLEGMVMVFQWIVFEYSVIKHAVFLKWLSEEEEPINYLMVRDHMMIMSRMTGYGQNDIKQNLEFSFENTILEWGHLALILGNSII